MTGVGETVNVEVLNRGRHRGEASMAKPKSLVYVRYEDHVLYHQGDPTAMKPQTRECVGWLVYEGNDYIIICWDRDAGAPSARWTSSPKKNRYKPKLIRQSTAISQPTSAIEH